MTRLGLVPVLRAEDTAECIREAAESAATDDFQFFLSESATRHFFDSAIQARRAEKLRAIGQLLHFATAERLLAVAVERFRAGGNTDRLDLASHLLSTMGDRALPSYLEMVRRMREEDRALLESLPLSELSTASKLRVLYEMLKDRPLDPMTDELWRSTMNVPRPPTGQYGEALDDSTTAVQPTEPSLERIRQILASRISRTTRQDSASTANSRAGVHTDTSATTD